MTVPGPRPLFLAVLLTALLTNWSVAEAAGSPSRSTTVTPPYADQAVWTDVTGCQEVVPEAAWGRPHVRSCLPYAAAEPAAGTLSVGVVDSGVAPGPCALPDYRPGGGWHFCSVIANNQAVPTAKASVTALLPRSGSVTVRLDVLAMSQVPQPPPYLSLLKVLVQQRDRTLATTDLHGSDLHGSDVAKPMTVTAKGASAGPLTVALVAHRAMPWGGSVVAGSVAVRSVTVGN